MNRTKQVETMMSKLEDIKIFFEGLLSAKQNSFDSKSEKWQDGDKGQEIQGNISDLENIISELESTYDNIDNLFQEE